MTTRNEPGIYIRGEFGIRLEDDMHVTESGAELFTPQSRRWRILSVTMPGERVSQSATTRTRSLRRHHCRLLVT